MFPGDSRREAAVNATVPVAVLRSYPRPVDRVREFGLGSGERSGMPFEGMGIDGYDHAQSRDVAVREEVVWTSDRSYIFTMYVQMPGADG